MNNCKSFLPHIDKQAEILILGSMPGIKSLKEQEYYAHPQNRFWKLMGMLCRKENMYKAEYNEKLKILSDNHFALWDVIKSCKRDGSLDTDIKNEIPNEINNILKEYPNIEIIILNGNKAYSAFKKYFPLLLKKYKCFKMPSTSPANAKYKLTDLYNEWIKYKTTRIL